MSEYPRTAEEWLEFMQGCRQRHHDLFVRLKREKEEKGEQLMIDELAEYNHAIRMEELGLVQPLLEEN